MSSNGFDGSDQSIEKHEPVFPPELERLIVETAVQDIRFPLEEGECCLNIQLTAKRFRQWCIPFLYRVLLPRTINPYLLSQNQHALVQVILKPYGRFVTDIAFEYSGFRGTAIDNLKLLLHHCPNVENLSLWDYTPNVLFRLFPALQGLPKLKRLGFVDGFNHLSPEQLDSPLFMNLTHLDIMSIDLYHCEFIVKFQNLTHLCINKNPSQLGAVLQRLTHPEIGCPSLQVIVNADQNDQQIKSFDYPGYFKLDRYSDSRDDWLDGVNGGVDFWQYSQEKVRQRHESESLTVQ